MGFALYDQYSLLHFSMGVIAFFWGMSMETFIIINIIFEILENTQIGYKIIRVPIKRNADDMEINRLINKIEDKITKNEFI